MNPLVVMFVDRLIRTDKDVQLFGSKLFTEWTPDEMKRAVNRMKDEGLIPDE